MMNMKPLLNGDNFNSDNFRVVLVIICCLFLFYHICKVIAFCLH